MFPGQNAATQPNAMWIVRLALRRPYTFVVMSVLIVILGLASIVRTPKDIFPDIDIPVISVIWTYNGLSAQDFEQRITIYSEFALSSNVNDIERIESQTIDGVGIIRLHFHPGVKIPSEQYNMAFGDSATLGTNDGEILIALKHERKKGAPAYAADLRTSLHAAFPHLTFDFQPADLVSQILNFGLKSADRRAHRRLQQGREFADRPRVARADRPHSRRHPHAAHGNPGPEAEVAALHVREDVVDRLDVEMGRADYSYQQINQPTKPNMSNTPKLAGKVAVVTGASKGIGAAIAKAFAAHGASVVVNYASSKGGADKTVDEIVKAGGKAIAVGGDVSKAAEVQALIDAAIKNYGRLDILVNNSGVYEFAPIEAVTEESFHRHFNINVLGVLLATQAAVKHLGEGASIINISSGVTTSSCRAALFTPARKPRSTPSPACSRKSSGPRRSGSTPSIPARSKPKGRTPPASSGPRWKPPWSRRPRSAASANPATSPPLPSSSPLTTPAG